MRSILSLLPLVLLAGCGDDGPQIDPAKVVSLDQLLGRESMVVTIFPYKDADIRGWPASVEDRQYVRFLQDQGISVVFNYSEEAGQHYVMVGMSDSRRVIALFDEAEKRGIPLPKLLRRDKQVGTPEVDR